MKLSYAITACNEHEEIIRLVTQLINYKGENSEIVVLLDTPKSSTEMIEYLELQANANYITLIESEFDNDFAQWKNFLNSHCKGEWIFQLDADEYLSNDLIYNLEEEKNYIEPSNPYKTKEFTIHSSNPPSTAELIWSNEVDSESLPDWKVNTF